MESNAIEESLKKAREELNDCIILPSIKHLPHRAYRVNNHPVNLIGYEFYKTDADAAIINYRFAISTN